ncbi:MAG TPA: SPOR domain-containing protein [Flavobacteriales bacterium]|nr:SPOR domain-containing protein [Flavobacteriales bacterium]MBP9137217.1 SPOR domain-containing protein [Flavobacteriales bacterium]HQX30184.1 SPOR domain-containing protein [Flavobacteriales bacterium]HQX37229.1 SPOR domain-containing protein [Flavobacteriales bacterium]HQZ41482.1 SPOR domain-containing protein [Flavobacteriales bacterium]
MRSILHFVLFLCSVIPALAQDDDEPARLFEPYSPGQIILDNDTPSIDTVHAVLPMRPGKVSYLTSPAIEKLMVDYADRKHPLRGYRVQIFLGERAAAENMKRGFLQKHPETPAYLSWLAPNFKLRVGDYRTRLEAEKMLHELRTAYPGCFVVPDEVEMPRL